MLNSNMAVKIVYGLEIFVDHTLKGVPMLDSGSAFGDETLTIG